MRQPPVYNGFASLTASLALWAVPPCIFCRCAEWQYHCAISSADKFLVFSDHGHCLHGSKLLGSNLVQHHEFLAIPLSHHQKFHAK